MHILVTRPEADAREMKTRLEAMGHRVSVAPLIAISHEAIDAAAFRGAAALIATSRNAIVALAGSPAIETAKSLPIFTVGSATARIAREAGIDTIIEGPGTARDLAEVIAVHPLARAGPLVHLAGDHLAVDLAHLLASETVKVRPLVVYRSIAAPSLPDGVIGALAARDIDAVILMSPRTARTWAQLLDCSAGLADTKDVSLICLSPAVAAALSRDQADKIYVSDSPNVDGVLSLVQRLARRSRTS
jgi:uroporphyrinogen-III synthase